MESNKLLEVLLWKEEEIISKVEEIVGITAFKDSENNYAYWDNGHQLCLQAHIDKVGSYTTSKHKWEWSKVTKKMEKMVQVAVETEKEVELVRCVNIVYNKNGILGADDRAGIMVILYVWDYCKTMDVPLPNILLTNHEESGGGGMKKFIEQCDKELLASTNLIVALDRRGCVDYVHYITPAKEVNAYAEMFGFIKSGGSYSDCKDLTDAWQIPHINLSVGYYNAHTKSEELHLDEMLLTANRVIEMIHYPIDKRHEVEKKKEYSYAGNCYGGYGVYGECDNWGGHGNYWNREKSNWWGLKNKDKDKNKDNVISIDTCIPISELDKLLNDAEIKDGWRVVCDTWDHYSVNDWVSVLWSKDSALYQTNSFHIFTKCDRKYVKSIDPFHKGEFFLAVKFKNKKHFTKLTEKRWEMDYGWSGRDELNEMWKEAEKKRDEDVIDAEGFESKEEAERKLLEYKKEENLYCLAFYEANCDGGCGGLPEFCNCVELKKVYGETGNQYMGGM